LHNFRLSKDLIAQNFGDGRTMMLRIAKKGCKRDRMYACDEEASAFRYRKSKHQRVQTQRAGRVMARQHALPPTLAPRLIGRNAAAAYVSLAPNTFDVMVRDGRMPKPRILTTGRKAWDVRLLDQAVDELPLDGEDVGGADRGWDD
jgi:hypothetical protein